MYLAVCFWRIWIVGNQNSLRRYVLSDLRKAAQKLSRAVTCTYHCMLMVELTGMLQPPTERRIIDHRGRRCTHLWDTALLHVRTLR
jgi:hypothetical protein